MAKQPVCSALATLLVLVSLTSRSLAAPRVDPVKIDLIPPGTTIAKKAPDGWTHLVVKSQPRVTSGDISKVSAVQIELASKFFMATLATVTQDGAKTDGGYRLVRLASGIGADVRGEDTIISPATADRLGARVGFRGGILLKEMYNEQRTVQIVLRSDTCAVYDTPIVLRQGGKNGSSVLRYGVVVNAETGDLETLAWLVETNDDGSYQQLAGHLQLLPNNMLIDCRLHVDASEYFLGIPNKHAFACLRIPRGRTQVSVSDQRLTGLLARPRWSEQEAASVEALLHKAVDRSLAAAKN